MYVVYWDVNNLYGLTRPQKLAVDGFQLKKKKSRFTHKFIQSYCDDSDKGYICEVDVTYPNYLQKVHSDLKSLRERRKIEKCHHFTCNMYGNRNYVVHINILTLEYRLMLEKVYRLIEFGQILWFKPYIDINIEKKGRERPERILKKNS